MTAKTCTQLEFNIVLLNHFIKTGCDLADAMFRF
jgi:hypothetical protein